MTDIFTLTLHPANLPYTVFLGVILVYWLTVVVGVLDFDFLDIEIDTDVDIDADVDLDGDTDVNVGGGGINSILAFLHIGKVPFMMYMSILAIVLWTTAMVISVYFSPDASGHFFTWVVPILITGLFLTKGLTIPLKRAHGKLNVMATKSRDLIGKSCTIITRVNSSGYGQAEITYDEQHFLLTVFSEEEEMPKNTRALIIGYDPEKEAYEVSSFHK